MRAKIILVLLLAIPVGVWETAQAVHILSARSAPLVEGEIIRREAFKRFGFRVAGRLTIRIAGTDTIVTAETNKQAMRLLPKHVKFHYTGDPSREVFIEGEENPLWVAVFLWVLSAGIVVFCVVPEVKQRLRKAEADSATLADFGELSRVEPVAPRVPLTLPSPTKGEGLDAVPGAADRPPPFNVKQHFTWKPNRLYRVYPDGPDLVFVFLRSIWVADGTTPQPGPAEAYIDSRNAKVRQQLSNDIACFDAAENLDELVAQDKRSFVVDAGDITRARLLGPGNLLKLGVHLARLLLEFDGAKHEFVFVDRADLLRALKTLEPMMGQTLEVDDKLRYSLGAAAWAGGKQPKG